MFYILTKTERYSVDKNGNIGRPEIGMSPSGEWKVLGLARYNNFGHRVEFIPFKDWPKRFSSLQWTYKNGKPRYRVVDLDHGTVREQCQPGLIRVELY